MVLKCAILLVCSGFALAGCDDRPPPAARVQKKLPAPTSESTFDTLLKKPPPAPPAPAHLDAEPASWRFPPQPVGTTEQGHIRFTNSGGSPLVFGAFRIAGQMADFQLGGDCRAGLPLGPGEACALDVAYHPRQAGSSQAELVVDQGAAGPALFLPLGGEALAAFDQPDQHGAADARASLAYASVRQAASLAIAAAADADAATPASPDYEESALPGVVTSYPVDRSRVLTADRYIPAVLENTLNSELPGRVIAVVERPVFGEDQRWVLIPAGSRIIGQYRAAAKYGQSRLDITWSRIIRPDGVNINIEGSGSDVMGRAGVPGDLDSRFAEKYGGSLLTSVIGAAGTWALANNSTISTSALGTTQTLSGRTQAANRLGNDVDNLAQRMVQDNLDIRPVLTVPAGTRLTIVPAEDIWLRDPNHLRPVTPPKSAHIEAKDKTDKLLELLPSLVDTVAQSPAVQRTMPQTAQQLMQSSLLQQLRADPALTGGAGPAKP